MKRKSIAQRRRRITSATTSEVLIATIIIKKLNIPMGCGCRANCPIIEPSGFRLLLIPASYHRHWKLRNNSLSSLLWIKLCCLLTTMDLRRRLNLRPPWIYCRFFSRLSRMLLMNFPPQPKTIIIHRHCISQQLYKNLL